MKLNREEMMLVMDEKVNIRESLTKEVDYANVKTPLKVDLPTSGFVREWPDSAIDALVTLAGRQYLQHGASQAIRGALDYNNDPENKKKGKWKKVVEHVSLAEFCVEVKVSKKLMEMAEQMCKDIMNGGDGLYKKYQQAAEKYGYDGLPDGYEDVTVEQCVKYQQAKQAYVAELI